MDSHSVETVHNKIGILYQHELGWLDDLIHFISFRFLSHDKKCNKFTLCSFPLLIVILCHLDCLLLQFYSTIIPYTLLCTPNPYRRRDIPLTI